jgi:iron complex outermembrane recepter protein
MSAVRGMPPACRGGRDVLEAHNSGDALMRLITVILFCSAAMCVSSLVPAFSQEAPDNTSPRQDLLEIVVTATKRSERLEDVPIAISDLTADDIAARGFTNYADYLNTVPGVSMQDLGPGKDEIYIRGIVATGGVDFPVATYFGEAVTSVVANNGGFANMRLVDIDHVEVLRGPQGTLFGANSLAGVIRTVPAAPNLSDFQVNLDTRGWATAHSSDGSAHAEGVINLPLIDDRLAFRLVGYQDYIAGYINNVVPAAPANDVSAIAGYALTGSPFPPGTVVVPGHAAFTRTDTNSENTWGSRASLRWKPVDDLTVDLSYAQQGVLLNAQPGVQQNVGSYDVQRPLDQYQRGYNREDLDIGQFVVTYDLSAATLTSATSYTQLKISDDEDVSWILPALGPPLWALDQRSKAGSFAEEIRLASRAGSPLQWLVGLYYDDATSSFAQVVPDFSCPTCVSALFGQNYALETLPAPGGGDPTTFKERQRSVFGEASYDFTSQWTVALGGRYLKDDIESLSPAACGFLGGVNSSGGDCQPATPPVGGSDGVFNPSGYLRFKPMENTTYYLQAAKGFRSGTSNQLIAYEPTGPCAASAKAVGLGPLTDPDEMWTYELGMKSAWMDGRVVSNLAIFHEKWTGLQLETNQTCGFSGTVNGGDASGNGAELEVTTKITPALSTNLSASYVYTKFDSVTPNLGYSPGDRIPGAPEENAAAGLQYNFEQIGQWRGYVRGDYVFVGDIHYKFGEGTDTTSILQGGYGQTNLRVAFQRAKLSLELFGNNVTDKRAAVATGDPTQGGYTYPLRPREIGIELRYSFGRTH